MLKEIKVMLVHENAVMPLYQTAGAAGADLAACLDEPVIILPGKQAIIPTGVAFEIPEGYEIQLRARSGHAAKYGIGLTNGIGTIDSDYRGEISVILINWGEQSFEVTHGMRIAQMVVAAYERPKLQVVTELSETSRSTQKFGSTGSL